MDQDTTTYVAFDTSKETLAVAIAEGGRRKEVRFFGTIASRPEAVRKLVEKLAKQHRRLAFCYEAGPTGYGLYRLPLRQFVRLDASEGRQYDYLWTEADDADGNRLAVVTYKVAQAAPEGRPGRSYLNTIREATRQRRLPEDYIAFLDRVEARE